MTATDPAQPLAHARSLLFVPGNRPERFAKALASGADAAAGLPANLTWTQDGVRAEVGPRDAAAWSRALAALGCEDAAAATSDPGAALPRPDGASPDGTPVPESRSGS